MDLGHDSKMEAAQSRLALQRWGSLASFLVALAVVAANLLYLTSNLRDSMGAYSYSIADFLYGPVWLAGLVTAVHALRERIGPRASHRTSLALLAAVAAGAAMLAVAGIRAANRHYHILHPELSLESNQAVLVVWTTLVAGVNAAGWHLLGWALLLIGSAGWTSALLPRLLCVLYWGAGAASLFVYASPDLEGVATPLFIAASIWQGFVLWRAQSDAAAIT
jgi:hypothetical protein